MNDIIQNDSLIDMWFPSRLDVENCPLDYFNTKYVYQIDSSKLSPANAKMRSGNCVESCVVDILQGNKSEAKSRDHFYDVLEQHHPINERDKHQKAVCLDQFNDVVTNLFDALKELKINPIDYQELVKGEAKGIDLELGGYVDLTTKTHIVEIKTAWSTALGLLKKDGTVGMRKPAQLNNPRPSHLRQVATYANGAKKPVHIIVADAFGYTIFNADNCEMLIDKNLKSAFETMRISARARQNLLKISTDPKVLARFIIPNFSHFVWSDIDDETLIEIKQIWGYEF